MFLNETPLSNPAGLFAGGKLAKVRKLTQSASCYQLFPAGVVNIFFGAITPLSQKEHGRFAAVCAPWFHSQNALQPHCSSGSQAVQAARPGG